MKKLIEILFVMLLVSSNLAGNIYAKSREVYLLPSKPGKAGRITPRTDKASVDWLIQYDGGVSNYYLGGLLPGDTLGIYFEPPAVCSLVEVHFCVYRPSQGCSEYYAMVGPAAYDISLLGIWPHSVPGPTPFDTIYIDTVMEIEVMEEFDWDTIVVPFMPDIGTNNFIGAVSACDTNFSIRIDPGVDPPYHAIGTQGLGWYISSHLYWIRALVKVYENINPIIEAEELLGTYNTDVRTVDIYTEDFGPSAAGIAELHLYYFLEGKKDTSEATVVQDSVDTSIPGFEYAWWHGVIPGQAPGSIVHYWLEGVDNEGAPGGTNEFSYMVGAGMGDYGLLYVEDDEAIGVMGIHNAFEGLPWDLWWEYYGGVGDNTVTDFYATGDGARAISWLTFAGLSFAYPFIYPWQLGWSFTQAFRDFMDAGGCLFLCGRDIPGGGFGLGYGEWVAPPSPHPLRDYLMAYGGIDDYIVASPFSVFVDTADVVTTGMSDEVIFDIHSIIPENYVGIFTDINEDCVPLFFDDEGNILGYRYEDAATGYKMIFLYFPFHGITDTDEQDIFIDNITNWFEVGVEEEQVELFYDLPMVTPNPISRPTTVIFTIPRNGFLSIKIYDVTGSLVKTLADERFNAGNHTLRLNTDELVSGVYFLKMDTGEFSGTRKFLVIK
ncbi:T9SS type A sorting domain-containing protein [candidate division WOR-3 bacterium]|nr:T9SS type A sorting domain-containing protein [candidate division WOR-3 bacterium]